MLDAGSPRIYHFLQNASIIFLSFVFFFPDIYILASSYVLQVLGPSSTRRRARRVPGFRPQTILVTGVGMTKGLSLARTFYLAGHDVVGADFEPYHIPVNGRFSKALKKYHRLPLPGVAENTGRDLYREKMLAIVQMQQVALWVSCSGVATAVSDARMMDTIQSESSCRCIQFSEHITSVLDDKGQFNDHVISLGLPAPEAHVVNSRQAVHRIFSQKRANGPKKKNYILKSIAMNDAARSDMTMLPRRTTSSTYDHVAKIPISSQTPYILQEFVGGKEYCTHALVIHNKVHAFTACPSSDLLMHYVPLTPVSPLHDALLAFTKEFAKRTQGDLTGHLSFDFIVQGRGTEQGVEQRLVPIECNPRTHTAVALFRGNEKEIARRYLAAAKHKNSTTAWKQKRLTNGNVNGYTEEDDDEEEPVFPTDAKSVYWIGHDLFALGLYPLLQLLTLNAGLRELVSSWVEVGKHLLFWKEGTFEIWDPLPWFWMYHVYWPLQFAVSIFWGKWWSRVNVSTNKKFCIE